MANFITVTSGSGDRVSINIDKIEIIADSRHEKDKCIIHFAGDNHFTVRNSRDGILSLIRVAML